MYEIYNYSIVGYGFVDFESGSFADAAVKGLQAKGVQAQMAKVGIPVQRRAATVRLLHEYIKYCYYCITVKQYSNGFFFFVFSHRIVSSFY